MTKTKKIQISESEKRIQNLNKCISSVIALFTPPKQQTLSEWADENRVLGSKNAEPGPWRTARTPYMKEPMDCITNYKIHQVNIVAPSQSGKSEFLLNIIGRSIDVDPCTIMLLQPTLTQAKRFSNLRIKDLISSTPCLKKKLRKTRTRRITAVNSETKVKDTVYEKSFPGGTLIMVGSNAPGDLASTPAKIVLGDERDRHSKSAGKEGDPWQLIRTRQKTFKNTYLAVQVSSPTTKGNSPIVDAWEEGTQAIWCVQCPVCGNFHEILFKDIRFDYETFETTNKKVKYKVNVKGWACPSCGTITDEKTIKHQPCKWVHQNPEALKEGIVSFWIKGFANTWQDWTDICTNFLRVKNNPLELQVFTNTILGELWEDRGEIATDDEFLSRRELYDAELPDGVLCLTAGIDTQDDRFEYEILGTGRANEEWVIEYGQILGKPNDLNTWKQLDEKVFDRVFKFKNGKGLKTSLCFVDSGGHYTKEVYNETLKRRHKHVFAIKGKGGEYPYTNLATKIKVDYNNKIFETHLYMIGVDAGKSQIMSSLKVETPGPGFVHFPLNPEANIGEKYFNGLLSEHPVWKGSRWVWEKLPGHKRNEPLDCHNYAKAATKVLKPNFDAIENRLSNNSANNNSQILTPHKQKRKIKKSYSSDEW